MCTATRPNGVSAEEASRPNQADAAFNEDDRMAKRWFQVRLFSSVLLLDLLGAVLFFTPLIPSFSNIEGVSWTRYNVYASVYDLAILAGLRVGASVISLLVGYLKPKPPTSPFDLYHANGDKKTREELEEEALEEALTSWFKRYASQRPSFAAEVICLLTGILTIVKCLARLDMELGVFFSQRVPMHPIIWLGLLWTCIVCILVTAFLESVTLKAGECGRARRTRITREEQSMWIRRIRSNLSIPLLSAATSQADDVGDLEEGATEESDESPSEAENPGDVRATADITGDSAYKADWTDLLSVIRPDVHFVALASIFLILAASAQIYIPRYTGEILDALAETFAAQDGKDHSQTSMWDVPGFMDNVVKLVVASILCGVFSAFRGSIFTIVGGRVNVRLRVQLMDSLLAQDIGFFDVTKTGDITSRLTSDTTLVGDQVQLNVNVFLRSLVQMIGVLIFMFLMSWQLSLVAFISVPVITILSKWYGSYVRSLTKLMQKKLADGNTVSEAAMGSMATVRAFDAAESELKEFEKFMQQYLDLNVRSAIAYLGYCTCITALPNLVTAVVLFYGGLLVRNGNMTSGNLVSFLLYLQSLSDAFSSIGYIFSSLTQAVGAADKVFELMNRKPKITEPSSSAAGSSTTVTRTGILGVEATKTAKQRQEGIVPSSVAGEVTLDNVEMYYPARPQRRILNGLDIRVPPGSVVALVGPSGSGKSSVMSLIQHLYEPKQGAVQIDGTKVHDLSPQWLSRTVSVVSQEPTLFARSVARNIMYGLEGTEYEPTMEQIQEAARLANAASFIEGLPFGYETDVGERGVQLSGGQKQRIAIARALVRKPRILLLDEATSALDAESEALVQEAIDDMLARSRSGKKNSVSLQDGPQAATSGPRMTVLIVAHRLSTVRNADIIFVIKDGQVVERGSHEELVQDVDGEYTNLINRQMSAQMKLEAGITKL